MNQSNCPRCKRLEEALSNIQRHQELIGGDVAMQTAVWRIANKALAPEPEQTCVWTKDNGRFGVGCASVVASGGLIEGIVERQQPCPYCGGRIEVRDA